MDTQLLTLLQNKRDIESKIIQANSDLDSANQAIIDYVNTNYPTLKVK